MKTYVCACGARIFFRNDTCLSCGRVLGFLSTEGVLAAFSPRDQGGFEVFGLEGRVFRKCWNYEHERACNWMVEAEDAERYCASCRLSQTIPDLADPAQRARWLEVEAAKRHLVHNLRSLGLPLVSKQVDPERGVAFDIMATTPERHVITGHAEGLITLDVAEADPVVRERARVALDERYRTVLGHFRHEIGHYFWDSLVASTDALEPFRVLFGDERADYAAALTRHYGSESTLRSWDEGFVSDYASTHPWEDWAETFAHYLHIVDTLETSRSFGLLGAREVDATSDEVGAFARELDAWGELSVALNALNRSMGLPDAYPFALSSRVCEKLAFVDQRVRSARSFSPASSKSE